MKHVKTILFLSLVLSLGAFQSASAQFRGDIFFLDPSIAVPEGGTAEMEIVVFTGADVLGAAQLEVLFDPALAEVVVEPGATPQVSDGLTAEVEDGSAGVVVLNATSLNNPFGTVSLARLQVSPTGAAGSRVFLQIVPRGLIRQNDLNFPFARGFAGEVLVVSSVSGLAATKADSGNPVASGPAAEKALTFRRPGTPVEVLELVQDGEAFRAVGQPVLVPDPGAPSDAEGEP